MTQGYWFLRTLFYFVAAVATFQLVIHFAGPIVNANPKRPLGYVVFVVALLIFGVWVWDVYLSGLKVRFVCKGCRRLSAKLTKKKVLHGYSQDFYECEACGHSEEAKDLGSW